MKHAQIRRTECTQRRDRCSRHQWLHSHETSRVFVRCSRTKSVQEDVRCAVPRTVAGKKNSSTRQLGKATNIKLWTKQLDKQITRAVAKTLPKNLIARTPVQVYLCGRWFRRPALPLSLCSQKMGRECIVCNSREIIRIPGRALPLHSYRRSEGGRRTTDRNGRALELETDDSNWRPLLAIRQETDGYQDGHRSDLPRATGHGPRATSHGPARPAAARARVAVLHPFLNFSIDAPMVHLFKLIDLSFELPIWY